MSHKKPVLSVKWGSDGAYIYSASSDCSACVWDSETFTRVKKVREHSAIVNDLAVCASDPSLFATCSDDGFAYLWDLRTKAPTASVPSPYQILSLDYSKDASMIYIAGIDNNVYGYDARKSEDALVTLSGHREAVTSAKLSPDNSYLLTYSRDNTVRVWDAKPFSTRKNRCLKIFVGASHDAENHLLRASWAPDGSRVAAGSVDRCVYVWDTTSKQILYKLPGHKGVVNSVEFHPTQPVILSTGADKAMYLGELTE
jgi:Prp8 binding protein